MYSKRIVIILTLIFSIIIFFSINIVYNKINPNLKISAYEREIEEIDNISKTDNQEIIREKDNIQSNQETQNNLQSEVVWKIEIPKISLEAPIAEGTTKETLNHYVGHFTETPNLDGNIGLAGHNRGYYVNYFGNLKEIKEGDEIIYTFGESQKKYVVTQNIRISDIDWSYLENTEENKITLITCIENEPAYRRCVQAIEK